jgi:hypothetical protein
VVACPGSAFSHDNREAANERVYKHDPEGY